MAFKCFITEYWNLLSHIPRTKLFFFLPTLTKSYTTHPNVTQQFRRKPEFRRKPVFDKAWKNILLF